MSLNTANNVHLKKHLGIIIFAVFFFSFFVSGAWASCYRDDLERINLNFCEWSGSSSDCKICNGGIGGVGSVTCENSSFTPSCAIINGTGRPSNKYILSCSNYDVQHADISRVVCTTACEADSVKCVDSGNEWTTIPGGTCDGKGCKEPADSTVCDGAKERCATLGGEFSFSIIDGECSSSCNTCGTEANKRILRTKSQSCCAQGLAPEVDQMCSTPVESGPGETYSTNANLTCSDPSLSEEAAQSYAENCAGGGGGSSSSDGGGSSSSGGSSGSDSAGVGRDYYPILDTIRDSLVDIRRNVENIYICLITPSACAGLSPGGDTVIVNASDSTYIKQIGTKLDGLESLIDTSIQNSSSRNAEFVSTSIASANDSLIDSLRKFLRNGDVQNMDSANRYFLDAINDNLIKNGDAVDSFKVGVLGKLDSLGGSIAGSIDSAWGNGSALGDSGYGGYGSDSSVYNGVLDSAYGSGAGFADSAYDIDIDTCTSVDCIVSRYDVDSAGSAFRASLDSTYDRIEDSSATWFDSIRANLKFVDFDSTLIEPLRNIVPNTNVCPEECFKGSISTIAGMSGGHEFDFGLCRNWNIGGVQINALLFVRLLLRILTAVCCIYIGLWFIAGRK